MYLALALFPDVDGLDDLIEASMPWFTLWLIALALALIFIVVGQGVSRFRRRSPVERLLRRRFG
jgi:hypothetical protein